MVEAVSHPWPAPANPATKRATVIRPQIIRRLFPCVKNEMAVKTLALVPFFFYAGLAMRDSSGCRQSYRDRPG